MSEGQTDTGKSEQGLSCWREGVFSPGSPPCLSSILKAENFLVGPEALRAIRVHGLGSLGMSVLSPTPGAAA